MIKISSSDEKEIFEKGTYGVDKIPNSRHVETENGTTRTIHFN